MERPEVRAAAGRRTCPVFERLLLVTLVLAFLYLTGAVDVGGHDAAYKAGLVAVWVAYFAWGRLVTLIVLWSWLVLPYAYIYYKIFAD